MRTVLLLPLLVLAGCSAPGGGAEWRADATGVREPLAAWEWTTGADGREVVRLVEPRHGSPSTFNLAWNPDADFRDGVLEVSLRADSGVVDQGGGLIWRARGPDDYYVARANPLEDNLRLYTVVDGRRRQLASADLPLEEGVWYRLRIEHVGDHVRVGLDGRTLLDVHDDTFSDAGGIGYWTKADAATSFADLVVERR